MKNKNKPLTEKQKKFIRKHQHELSVDAIAKRLSVSPEQVRRYLEAGGARLSRKKLLLFRIAMVLLPVLFFLLLEAILRLSNYGGNLSLFIEAPGEYSDYYMCNPNVGRRYFFMQSTIPDPPLELFLKQKPTNGYRIFVLGGSTAAGYPYGNNIMFTRVLQKRLADAFPERYIEVINTAIPAINSYTLLDFMDEILEQQPDMLLIYAGHNEFYGALGVGSNESMGKFRGFVKFYLKLERYKTFLFLRDILAKVTKQTSEWLFGGSPAKPSGTLMERMVAEQTIPYGSPLYQLGRRQFAGNLEDILRQAKKAGVPVVLSELVSNIRDMKPFVSVAADSLPPAGDVFRQARVAEQAGEYDTARQLYYRAKDLDALRFRATEDFNAVIHELARRYNVPVVPLRRFFEQKSPHGLMGDNLFLEHLHPNVDGYFLMADAFFETLRQHRMISREWKPDRLRPAAYYRETWGLTELDTIYANLRIRILKGNWPFKPRWQKNMAMANYHPTTLAESLAVKIILNDKYTAEMAHVDLAKRYERLGQYVNAFREYYANLYATPQNISPYIHAANMLIKARQFARALPILYQSLKVEETAFAYKWIGQILLDRGNLDEAIPFLEKALNVIPNDAQLLYNLAGARALQNEFEQALALLQKLETIQPGFPGARDLMQQIKKVIYDQKK
ncbi:MAG: GDSL-type esterase/lipase family protein [candidate division KSB1 bacterium]|nr:GDSL-type esterase/lipase family protein [candidate division KSB1 bacterium]